MPSSVSLLGLQTKEEGEVDVNAVDSPPTINEDEEDKDGEEQETQQHLPPPPPPLPKWGAGSDNYPMQLQQERQQQQRQPPPPVGARSGWMMGSSPPSQESWQIEGNYLEEGVPPLPPPQYYDQSYGAGPNNPYYYGANSGDFENSNDSTFLYLQDELNESLVRESSLIAQLDNLTTAVVVMEQREELHMRQLDVLTERVIDVESKAAEDRNLLLEYEANCTALSNTIVGLQEDLDEWQRRCHDLMQRRQEDQETLTELQQLIQEKENEAEELAVAMEQLRMTEKRHEAGMSKLSSHAGGGGFLSWLFGGWLGIGSNGVSSYRRDEQIRDEAFEMAKSTLLRALQSERANVHELEAAVASLQQNNSAISEMVESRDIIVNELNDRIAVFEEDKVVLKAALRQLQKEMNEEAPKTQKLLDDLAEAEVEVDRLKADITSIIETHQEELIALQGTISMKQKTITDAESNLTAIGTYVDKLEERLTSFAVTRRDMDEREKRCKEIEKAAEESESQRQVLAVRVEEYQKGEEDLKKLLEELATSRGNLLKENRKLYTEQEFRLAELEQLEVKCKALESKSVTVDEDMQRLRDRCETLASDLEASRRINADLEQKVETSGSLQAEVSSLQSKNDQLQEDISRIQDLLVATTDERNRLEELLGNVTKDAVEAIGAKADTQSGRSQVTDAESLSEPEEESQTTQPGASSSPPPPPPDRKNSRPPPGLAERKVPLRSLRKQLSKVTGIHGVITPSSRMLVRRAGTRSRPRPILDATDGRKPQSQPIPKALPQDAQRRDSSSPPPPPPPPPVNSAVSDPLLVEED